MIVCTMQAGLEIISATGPTLVDACMNAFMYMVSDEARVVGSYDLPLIDGIYYWGINK